jgi:anti-sigma regulatory factor (Ser/Thr protein kinase)
MLQTKLPKTPESAAAARRLIDEVGAPLDAEAKATAHLLVTELVANAVRHVADDGDVGVEIRMDERDGRLYVAIVDPGTGFEFRPRTADSPKGGGWGLHLLDVLSDRWGMQGGRVWFELRPHAATA